MRAVFRHELDSYFSNISGYVFGAFLLLFAGIFTMVYNLKGQIADFSYVPRNMGFIFLVIVPIITMKSLAEERRQKTDQLLYSLPLNMTQVVLGKYLALLVMLLIPTAVMCIYPAILNTFGNLNLAGSYSAIAGFFLLGAALLAIGLFISSLTESQAVAAGLCFVVMLLCYFLSNLANYIPTTAIASIIAFTVVIIILALIVRAMTKSNMAAVVTGVVLEIALVIFYFVKQDVFTGMFASVVDKLSVYERFEIFTHGVFDITGIVYFLSVIAIFIFLSIQSMEKRRWS